MMWSWGSYCLGVLTGLVLVCAVVGCYVAKALAPEADWHDLAG